METPTETVDVSRESNLTSEEARALIGQQIGAVEAGEHYLILTFIDGTALTVEGHRFEDSPLGCDYDGVP